MNVASKILIVDDEPNVRLVFRTTFESAGHQTAEAVNGVEALELLRDSSFDLVLLDLQMPGEGGMTVLERLRVAGNDTPVVIVTAYGTVPDAVEAMKLGAIDFLGKPLSPAALREVVGAVLARNSSEKFPGSHAVPSAHVTVGSQFARNLSDAKRALNRRQFEEAEVYLKQSLALDPNSAEAHNLMGVLHELRNEHDACYREYKAALKSDRHYEPAKHNITRYYERFTFGSSKVPVDTGDR